MTLLRGARLLFWRLFVAGPFIAFIVFMAFIFFIDFIVFLAAMGQRCRPVCPSTCDVMTGAPFDPNGESGVPDLWYQDARALI